MAATLVIHEEVTEQVGLRHEMAGENFSLAQSKEVPYILRSALWPEVGSGQVGTQG